MRPLLAFLVLVSMTDRTSAQPTMTAQDLLGLPQPTADETVAYGAAPQQFAELRLPEGTGLHPVVVVIHGGCWETPWGLDHVRGLCAALTAEGLATWSLEYRRLGDEGGGWQGTFEDVGRGADHLRDIAARHPLDLERVVALGHSAGGHLALWLAGRHRLPHDSALRVESPLRLRGVVSLGGIPDLREGAEQSVCGDAIPRLLGSSPGELEARLRVASPMALLPLGLPQRLVCGRLDTVVPLELASRYASAARRAGDRVDVEVLPGAGHLELVNPQSAAWPAVSGAVKALLAAPPP